MFTTKVGQAVREWSSLDDIEESWITQQIMDRRRYGQAVCVYVRIAVTGIDVGMVAGECSPGRGGGRWPNEDERRILELWSERTGGNGFVDPGDIIAFFKQLRRLI